MSFAALRRLASAGAIQIMRNIRDWRNCRGATRAALILTLWLVPGCASVLDEDGALTVIPYRIAGSGQIVVDATINEMGPFAFAFDTGASISVVFDNVRDDTGLECVADRQVVIQGMVGSGRFPIAIIDRLRLGNEVWADARLAAMPGGELARNSIDGILGVDFLDRYAVSFSTEEKVLRLYAPEAVRERSYRGWEAVPLRQMSVGKGGSNIYVVDIRIGSVTIPALLDLGATSNIMNWRAARALRVRPVRPQETSEIAGAVESAPIVAQLEVKALKTGDLRWARKTFIIADFPVFGVLGLDDLPVAIIGAELFSRRDFVIDFTKHRLLVKTAD